MISKVSVNSSVYGWRNFEKNKWKPFHRVNWKKAPITDKWLITTAFCCQWGVANRTHRCPINMGELCGGAAEFDMNVDKFVQRIEKLSLEFTHLQVSLFVCSIQLFNISSETHFFYYYFKRTENHHYSRFELFLYFRICCPSSILNLCMYQSW